MADDIVTRLKRELEEIRRSGYGHDWPLSQAIAVIEAQQAEIERLQRWKVEACSVLADWDALYAGLDDDGELGQRKSAVVADVLERLTEHNRELSTRYVELLDHHTATRLERDRLRAAGDALAVHWEEMSWIGEPEYIAWKEARRG